MSERHARVEQALTELAEWIEYPPTPDLAAAVSRRLAPAAAGAVAAPSPSPAPRAGRPLSGWRRAGWRRAGVKLRIALAVVLLLALVTALVPGPRTAAARLWDLIGVRIVSGPVPGSIGPAPAPRPGQALGANLSLGRRVGLAEAGRLAGGRILVPAAVGPPDAVWYRPASDGPVDWDEVEDAVTVVSLAYRERPGLPASPYSGTGLLLSTITGSATGVDPQVLFNKAIAQGQLEVVERGGRRWYWVEGPHQLYTGGLDLGDGRQAGNTLLWRDGGRTYRLEAQIGLDEAIRIASSLR